jgi:hypothetical protein
VPRPRFKLLSELQVGAFLIYPPRPIGDVAETAKAALIAVKNDGPGFKRGEPMIEFVARRLREEITGSVLEPFFAPGTILVPAPGHAPRRVKNQLWATKRLCEALVAVGLGDAVASLLERQTAVPRAAHVKPGEQRPTAMRHAETIRAVPDLTLTPKRILIVDDVVTRGAVMLGCASVLAERYPDATIEGFALTRTHSNAGVLTTPLDPAVYLVERVGTDDCNCRRLTALNVPS